MGSDLIKGARSDAPPSVSVVVVNWNGESVLGDCLASIFALTYPITEVIVVDNGSVDRSIARVREVYGERVTVIENEKNLGAPMARNQGIRRAVASGVDFVFSLDNDLTVAPEAIGVLVEVLTRDPAVAMAGALILDRARPDVVLSAGHRINWTQNLVKCLGAGQTLRGQFRGSWEVDYAGSGALLTRGAYLREFGSFDESYLGYGYEDTDFGYRANLRGWKVLCCAEAKVWHRPHTGIGRYSYRKKYLEARNAVLFMRRHGNAYRWTKYLFYLFAGFAYAAVREGVRGNLAGVRGKLHGFVDGVLDRKERAYALLQGELRT